MRPLAWLARPLECFTLAAGSVPRSCPLTLGPCRRRCRCRCCRRCSCPRLPILAVRSSALLWLGRRSRKPAEPALHGHCATSNLLPGPTWCGPHSLRVMQDLLRVLWAAAAAVAANAARGLALLHHVSPPLVAWQAFGAWHCSESARLRRLPTWRAILACRKCPQRPCACAIPQYPPTAGLLAWEWPCLPCPVLGSALLRQLRCIRGIQ